MGINKVLQLTSYKVRAFDSRTGESFDDVVVFDKETLRAAEALGLYGTDHIKLLYANKGYKVSTIAKLESKTVSVDLQEIFTGKGELQL